MWGISRGHVDDAHKCEVQRIQYQATAPSHAACQNGIHQINQAMMSVNSKRRSIRALARQKNGISPHLPRLAAAARARCLDFRHTLTGSLCSRHPNSLYLEQAHTQTYAFSKVIIRSSWVHRQGRGHASCIRGGGLSGLSCA